MRSSNPAPAGWVATPSGAGSDLAYVRDPEDPASPRLVSHVEFAASLSVRGWRDRVVEGLARTLEDWVLVDVGPVRVAETRGFQVVGCSTPPGRPARMHHSWCAIRQGQRCSVTLTCRVDVYDDIVDEVAAAVRDWQPVPEGKV